MFVSDICVNFPENTEPGVVEGRNMKTRLSHKGKKSHGFQRNGLTAGVGTGNYQKVEVFSQADINGHHLMFFDQRVPGFFQVNDTICVKLGLCGVLRFCQKSTGKDKVQLSQDLLIILDQFQAFSGSLAETGKDFFNLSLFLDFHFPKIVIQFYYGHGFYKNRRTGGGLVVDHTGNLASVFGFYGNTVPAVPHGDHSVLKIGPGTSADIRGQLAVDLFINVLHVPADLAEPRTGVICDFLRRQDAAADLRRQKSERFQNFKHGIQRICISLICIPPGIGFCPSRIFQKTGNVQKFSCSQGSSDLQSF